jgi:dipeptidyl-peptidase-4
MRNYFTSIILFFLVLHAHGQQKKLTNEAIWDFEFSQETLESIHPLKSQSAYTVIKVDHEQRQAKIVLYDYATAKELDVLVDSSTSAKIPFFTAYYFSKDEQKILLETAVEPIYRRSKRAEYWVLDRKTKEVNYLFSGKVQEPRFSPDGSKVAFVYMRNLYIKDLVENSIEQVTTNGDKDIINGLTDWVYEEEFGVVRAFDWNASGTSIAFMQFDESQVPEFSMDIYGDQLYQFPYTFKYPKAGEKNAVVSLHLYALESKEIKGVQLGDVPPYYIPRFEFAPQENRLIVQTINRLQNQLILWEYNAEDGKAKELLQETSDTYVDVHSNLRLLPKGDFLWTSERDGYNHIYHYNADGSLKQQVTKGPWEVTRFFGLNPKTKEVYYASVETASTERAVYSIGLNGKKKRALTPEKGTNGVSFSADYRYYIHTYEDAKTPRIYNLRATKNGALVREIENNAALVEKLKGYTFTEKEFSTINVNGEELNMWIMKPTDFDPKKKYPLFMYQYSGPGSQKVANKWYDQRDLWHQLLTQKGYIVACVDGRGTGFKGAAFKKVTYQQLTKYETEDQIAAAKKLGTLPYIDANRIGIWGWSYGGHMSTNCILKGNDVFALAIAVAPVTNWRFYDTIYTERFMRTPQENPEGYDLNSPLNYAHLLKGKYLLIHGSGDDNVHVQNTMRMVEALVQANKQFDWAIYPDKNHGIYGGNTSTHLFNKMTTFIENNL